MYKKQVFLSAAGLCVFFLSVTSTCMADAGTMLEEARSFVQAAEYSEARTAFENIVQTYPDQEQAIWALSDLARMELRLNNDSAAETVIANLKTAYAGNAYTAHALHDIAYLYHALTRYGEARDIFQYILENFPGNEFEVWALSGMATQSLKLGDMATGNAAAERLVTEFSGHADMAFMASDVATAYVRCEDYDRGEKFYRRALDSNPQPETRMWALTGLAKTKVVLGKYNEVEPLVGQLILRYSSDAQLPSQLGEIAKCFTEAGMGQEAQRVYAKVYALFLDSKRASTLRLDTARGYVRCLIDSSEEAQASEGINTLISGFQGDPGLSSALDDLGNRYGELNRYEAAGAVYQKILDHCSTDDIYATKARIIVDAAALGSSINSGQHQAVDNEVSRLIAQYQGFNDLPSILSRFVGERYYIKALEYEKQGRKDDGQANLLRAVAIWDKVLDDLPASKATPSTCHWAGDCCARLGDYQKAVRFYKRVADDYPDYEMRWHTLFMLGRSYQVMAGGGLMSKKEADTCTRAAYQTLLNEHPDSKAAKAARMWLNR